MRQIPTKTTYLEMLSPPSGHLGIPPEVTVEVHRLRPATVELYRDLYAAVGSDYHWVDRTKWPDDQLQAVLQDDRVEVHLLQVQKQPAGFAELDRRTATQVELAYFGLFPMFIGRGLGKYFLEWTVRQAWTGDTKRVWVHTCDLDHPAALPNYLGAGFRVYDEKTILQEIPDAVGEAVRRTPENRRRKTHPE